MNIFFDHQTFSLQSYGGISRYFAELVSGINRTNNNSAYLPILFSDNVHLREAGLKTKGYLPKQNFYKKLSFTYRSNQVYTTTQLQRSLFDVFHATYYDPYFIKYLKGRPFVVTFLDMIHEKFSLQFPALDDGGLHTKQKHLLANRADRIIAISESTKRDIVELFNINPDKIDVIYLANSLKPLDRKLTNLQMTRPYLLFVGRRERYKNFEGLLKAIYPLLKKYNIRLLCAGGGAFTNGEQSLIRKFGVENLTEQQPINDVVLATLYENAIAFIFPTLYEGFGIPILEAFACGCPCIVSNLSSLPEVAGNAALYINPIDSDSIVTSVERLLNDSQLRQDLTEKGRNQLLNFSWQQTVQKTLNLYSTLN